MDDKKIIELYNSRAEDALAETEKKYGNLVIFIIRKILTNRLDVEECVNDTYLGIWTTIPPKSPDNFKAYVLKIARNQALKRYEYLHAKKRDENVCLPYEEMSNFLKGEGVDCADENGLKETLEEFLSGISKTHRQVFMLRYWYFMPVREIALCCGMSKSKTESILFRVRKKLKIYLEERRYL